MDHDPPPQVLLDALPEAVLLADEAGRVTHLNAAARRLLRLSEQAARGRPLTGLLSLDEGVVRQALGDGRRLLVPVEAGGVEVDVLISLRCTGAGEGRWAGCTAVVVALDGLVTSQQCADRRLHSLLGATSELVSVHGPDMQPRYVAGRGVDQGAGSTPDLRRRVHPDDLPRLERGFARWLVGEAVPVQYRARGRAGGWRTYESTGRNLLGDPAVGGVVVTTRDIDERVRMQQELVRRALHDPLTDLPSRGLFLDRLQQGLALAGRVGHDLAVLRVDVNAFRGINATFGQATGDQVLRVIAGTLREVVPLGDTVARVGGDEFAICCQSPEGVAGAEQLGERIVEALAGPVEAEGRSVPLTISVGIALVPGRTSADAETALHRAEVAVHHAKRLGGGPVALFHEAMGDEQQRLSRLRRDLLAVEEQELSVHYQPQVRLSTGELTGFEALLRWRHPVLGDIGPAEFIPLAEETGIILPLGRFVLETACRDLAVLRRACPERDLRMAVNVSTRQLVDDRLADHLDELLRDNDLEAGALCMEITESAVLERGDLAEKRLRELKSCGVQLAIDDFGTGYSSLAYLKRFPLDQVKIDREFVSGLGTNPEDAVIVASVARLGASLQLEVVAEGVETQEHRDELAALGCDLGQGYLWSRPRPVEELEGLLAGSAWAPASPRADAAQALGAEDAPDVDEVVALLRHELADPVTVIQGYADLLQHSHRGGAAPPVGDALAAISRSTAGLQSLIHVLTDLRLIGEGVVPLDLRPVDLAAATRGVLTEMADALSDRPVRFEGEAAPAVADVGRVRQIVRSLLDNAVQHTAPGTPIEVLVRTVGDRRELRVADRGPGVRPEQTGQLFRKFSRLGARGDGTGLGLFVARGLARAHGGDLRHEPHPEGEGAVFVLHLPAGASEPVTDG